MGKVIGIFALAVLLLPAGIRAEDSVEKAKPQRVANAGDVNTGLPELEADLPRTGADTMVVPRTAPGKFYGFFETRPSWTTNVGEVHTEDTAQLGYKVSPTLKFTYIQYFNTRVYNSATSTGDIYFTDGWLYGQLDNLLVSRSGNDTFGIRETIIPPTDPSKRARGFVGTFRSYLKYNHKFSNSVNMDAWAVPMAHFYSRPGDGVTGAANPFGEVEFILQPVITLGRSWEIDLPIIWETVKYRNFAPTAKHNDRWEQQVWVWPQVIYNVSSAAQLGIAYYSDLLFKPDLSGTTFGTGFKNGVFQTILNVSL